MRVLVIFLMVFSLLGAATVISPERYIESSSNVTDIRVKGDKLYVATAGGVAEVFDIKSGELLQSVKLEDIENYYGERFAPKVFSIDELDGEILLLAEAEDGYRNLFLYDGNTKSIITKDDRMMIKKAAFIDKNTVMLGLVSNELIFFDISKKESLKNIHPSTSTFSDFFLDTKRMIGASTDESGKVYVLDLKNRKISKTLSGANKDNCYKVCLKTNKISTAGQDRLAGVYDMDSGAHKEFKAEFLIYAAALSPSAKKIAYQYNEANDIALANVDDSEHRFILKGHNSTLNGIVFLDEESIISASDDKKILIWRIK